MKPQNGRALNFINDEAAFNGRALFYVASFPFLTSYFINSLYSPSREYLVPVLYKYLNASFPCSLTKGNPLPLVADRGWLHIPGLKQVFQMWNKATTG